jgi:hypothetical protein
MTCQHQRDFPASSGKCICPRCEWLKRTQVRQVVWTFDVISVDGLPQTIYLRTKVELSRRNLTTSSLQACVYTVRWRVPSPRHWTPSRAGRCTVIYTPQSAPTQPRILLQRGTTALRRVPFLAGAARLGPGRSGRRRLGVPMSLSRSGVHPAPLWVYDDDGGGGHVRGAVRHKRRDYLCVDPAAHIPDSYTCGAEGHTCERKARYPRLLLRHGGQMWTRVRESLGRWVDGCFAG